MNPSPLKIWQDKLKFLHGQLATVSDPAQKFSICQQIAEAREMIVELTEAEDGSARPTCQTVVVIDLCHFTEIIRSLEIGQRMGPIATQHVQNQVEELIRFALEQSDSAWENCFVKGTGDGAVLCFASARAADRFAEALLLHADEDYNRQAGHELEYRCFRVGIYTGNVIRTSRDIAGAAVSFAARLESAAATGEVLIDAESWIKLPPELREKYGPEEQVLGKHHDRPFLVRRRRIGMPSPWDTSTGSEDADELATFLKALSAIRGLGAAKPPDDYESALNEGKEKVSQHIHDLAGAALNGLTLDHVETVITEAIHHGAGIYNHSVRGRIGCGEIYFLAASGLLKLGASNLTGGDALKSDASLALSWLQPIIHAAGEITDENGDDVAWELRYCFDSIPLVPRCDEVATMLRDIARRNDVLIIPRIVRQVVERSRELRPHVSAYELRHTVRTLLWLCDHEELKDRRFRRVKAILRRLNELSSRIVMRNAQLVQRELASGLINLCQDMEADGGNGSGLFGWFKRN